MARSCVFCGKDDVTKEHLFAKWVRDAYCNQAKELQVLEFARDGSLMWSYEGNTLDQNVKAFFAKCNNA